MIFPFMLLIADIFLWWLALDVMSLGDTLINIGMFGLAFGGFIWVVRAWKPEQNEEEFHVGTLFEPGYEGDLR